MVFIYRPLYLAAAVASKQSGLDRYVTNIAIVGCSNRHASLGKWANAASSQLLPGEREPSVELMPLC